MKIRSKRANFILILTIFLFIPLFSTYFQYNNLSGSIFLSDEMSFEDPGDEDLSMSQDESKALLPAVFFETLLQGSHVFEETSAFFSHLISHSLNTAILRC